MTYILLIYFAVAAPDGTRLKPALESATPGYSSREACREAGLKAISANSRIAMARCVEQARPVAMPV